MQRANCKQEWTVFSKMIHSLNHPLSNHPFLTAVPIAFPLAYSVIYKTLVPPGDKKGISASWVYGIDSCPFSEPGKGLILWLRHIEGFVWWAYTGAPARTSWDWKEQAWNWLYTRAARSWETLAISSESNPSVFTHCYTTHYLWCLNWRLANIR